MIEKINLENYEAYFLDYAEGNLTESQLLELDSFLEKQPSLKVELENFESIVLEEEPAIDISNLQSELKREEATGLLLADYLMISEVEGTISVEEKAQLASLIRQSPEKIEELAIYHKTRLTQDEVVVFTEKSALLQKEKKGVVWWPYVSSVAAAALVIFLFNFSFVSEKYSPRGFAWQKAPINYEESIQYRFIAQEKEVSIPIKKEKISSTKILDRTFANKVEPETKPFSEENIDKEENPILPLVEDNEMAQIETISTPEKELASDNSSIPEEVILASNNISNPAEEKFIPIHEFAKSKIKDDVLKGKTFSETILDEIAEASKEKITFKRKKDRSGTTQNFALNIGKFSISRNK
ncbi:MAG: hypothetical protein JKY48_17720 [Flavobacteriales bacterium]|nr:hypothetical protein [Flavobacteriales bacterium]